MPVHHNNSGRVADAQTLVSQIEATAQANQRGRGAPRDLGMAVAHKYEDGINYIGGKFGEGLMKIATSGFGKGLLITAAVIVGVAALSIGFPAALSFLGTGWGILAAVGGGIVGSVIESAKENLLTSTAVQDAGVAKGAGNSFSQTPALQQEWGIDGKPEGYWVGQSKKTPNQLQVG